MAGCDYVANSQVQGHVTARISNLQNKSAINSLLNILKNNTKYNVKSNRKRRPGVGWGTDNAGRQGWDGGKKATEFFSKIISNLS